MRRMVAGLHDQLVVFDIADEELGCLADDIVLVIGGAALFGVATTASWRILAREYIGRRSSASLEFSLDDANKLRQHSNTGDYNRAGNFRNSPQRDAV